MVEEEWCMVANVCCGRVVCAGEYMEPSRRADSGYGLHLHLRLLPLV